MENVSEKTKLIEKITKYVEQNYDDIIDGLKVSDLDIKPYYGEFIKASNAELTLAQITKNGKLVIFGWDINTQIEIGRASCRERV